MTELTDDEIIDLLNTLEKNPARTMPRRTELLDLMLDEFETQAGAAPRVDGEASPVVWVEPGRPRQQTAAAKRRTTWLTAAAAVVLLSVSGALLLRPNNGAVDIADTTPTSETTDRTDNSSRTSVPAVPLDSSSRSVVFAR